MNDESLQFRSITVGGKQYLMDQYRKYLESIGEAGVLCEPRRATTVIIDEGANLPEELWQEGD